MQNNKRTENQRVLLGERLNDKRLEEILNKPPEEITDRDLIYLAPRFILRCLNGELIVLKKEEAVCPVCGYEFESRFKSRRNHQQKRI